MTTTRQGPGLQRALAVWALWAIVAAATFATNARIPPSRLYAVHHGGPVGAAGRVVVLLGWPIAIAAIPIVWLAADRMLDRAEPGRRRLVLALSVVAVALCATIALPGVTDPKHVDLRAVNVPAAVGTALAFAMTVWAVRETGAGPRPHRPSARALLALAVGALIALPWLLANLGFYVGDVPILDHIFMSKQIRPEHGYRHLRAVHLGNHDGFDGLLLTLTACLLVADARRVRWLRDVVIGCLSILFVYGLGVAAADWSLEQVKKRGWTKTALPDVGRPAFSLAWAVILAASASVWLLLRRNPAARPRS